MSDQIDINGIPKRYLNNRNKESPCLEEYEFTAGILLSSNDRMNNQISCLPSVGNSGNLYSWPASTAGGKISGGDESNTICPKNWKLSSNSISVGSFYYLYNFIYLLNYNGSSIYDTPLSLVASGYYDGNINSKGDYIGYWTLSASGSTDAYYSSGNANMLGHYVKYRGYSVRCVAR